MSGRLRLQRYMGRPGRPEPTAGQWLVMGAGLQLRRGRRRRGWSVEPCSWISNAFADPHQARRAECWLRRTGLTEVRFPTRRAALGELQRLHQVHPLPLYQWD